MLEDDILRPSNAARAKLASALKNFTVSTRVQSCHRKRETAVNLRPFWRVSVSLNDDPESLHVLPPMEQGVKDKIILLRASRFEMPMPNESAEERLAFEEQLKREIPAFVHWLLNEFEIPVEHKDRRFVVRTWHHPEVLQELDELSPEMQLMEFIDASLPGGRTWEGTAQELYELLRQRISQHLVNQLIKSANALGTMLGKLAKKYPARIQKARKTYRRGWRIHPREGHDAMTA